MVYSIRGVVKALSGIARLRIFTRMCELSPLFANNNRGFNRAIERFIKSMDRFE